MRGFASSVLSCPERERLEEQSRTAEKRDGAKVHGVVNSTLRYVPGRPGRETAVFGQVGPGSFPALTCEIRFSFLLSSTEV